VAHDARSDIAAHESKAGARREWRMEVPSRERMDREEPPTFMGSAV
jgi:hypothetical protein